MCYLKVSILKNKIIDRKLSIIKYNKQRQVKQFNYWTATGKLETRMKEPHLSHLPIKKHINCLTHCDWDRLKHDTAKRHTKKTKYYPLWMIYIYSIFQNHELKLIHFIILSLKICNQISHQIWSERRLSQISLHFMKIIFFTHLKVNYRPSGLKISLEKVYKTKPWLNISSNDVVSHFKT